MGSLIHVPSKRKSFQIDTLRLFLTYSRCPEHWSKEFVKENLIDQILIHKYGKKAGYTKVRAYVISEEKHEAAVGSGDYERNVMSSGERGKHYHCLVEFERKTKILNERELDIEGIHGNYQVVKDVFAVLNYVKKHGDWMGEGFPGMESRERTILQASEQDAKLMLMPEMSVKEKLSLREQMVERIERKTVIEEVITRAPLFAFQEALMPFHKGSGFFAKGRPMGLIMSGEAESGKTTMAYRVAKELGHDIATYRDPKEMLHHGEEQVILFDEMTKERFEENRGLLSLLVTEPYAKTTSYYGSKKVKWPRKVLIATNEDVKYWDWDEATRSRFIVVKTNKDDSYEFLKFEGKYLIPLSKEEIKEM